MIFKYILVFSLIYLTSCRVPSQIDVEVIDGNDETPVTGDSLVDWSPSFTGVWNFEEATGANALDTSGNSNDLTEDGGAITVTTPKIQGDQSVLIGNSHNYSNVSAGLQMVGNSLTLGCWTYPAITGNPRSDILGTADTLTNGYRLYRSLSDLKFNVRGVEITLNSVYSPMIWEHTVGRFNDITNEIEAFHDGIGSGTPITQNNPVDTGDDSFRVSNNEASNDFPGNLDECFLIDQVLTTAEICRICSCGIDGSECSCSTSDSTAYADLGRNATQCNSCTLPSCDAPAP